jgi:hypothetical protein
MIGPLEFPWRGRCEEIESSEASLGSHVSASALPDPQTGGVSGRCVDHHAGGWSGTQSESTNGGLQSCTTTADSSGWGAIMNGFPERVSAVRDIWWGRAYASRAQTGRWHPPARGAMAVPTRTDARGSPIRSARGRHAHRCYVIQSLARVASTGKPSHGAAFQAVWRR